MKTKLWLFFIAFALVFSACEKDDEYRGGPPDWAGKGRDISFTAECDISKTMETPLIAGQHHEVGTVTVEFENGSIKVTYKTIEGWFLTETHLHIANELHHIPVNKAGNPMIGLFELGNDDIATTEAEYIFDIPDDWKCPYYIAAHAVVTGGEGDVINLDAFAASLPETATVAIDHPADSEDSYFNVHVSDAGILDGTWPGWCIQTGAAIVPGPPPTYEHDVYSSYEDVPGYDPVILMKINWILNHNFIGQGYTYGEVQIAMWTLLHGYDEFDDDVKDELQATSPNPLEPSVIGAWTEMKVNEILGQVKYIDKFYPECGDVIAIVFLNDEAQDLIIEYPFPCYQDETAWGQGCLFNDKSWAMYFQVCP